MVIVFLFCLEWRCFIRHLFPFFVYVTASLKTKQQKTGKISASNRLGVLNADKI